MWPIHLLLHAVLAWVVLDLGAIPCAAAESDPNATRSSGVEVAAMQNYRNTSHSLAMIVHQPEDVPVRTLWWGTLPWFSSSYSTMHGLCDIMQEDYYSTAQAKEPWWWLVAVPGKQQADVASLPWSQMRSSFEYVMSQADCKAIFAHRTSMDGEGVGISGINDPKIQTVHVQGVYFRAYPQGICLNNTEPPAGSFLPQALPLVDPGTCITELDGLAAETSYHIILFDISDGSKPPDVAPEPVAAELLDQRTEPNGHLHQVRVGILCVSILTTLFGLGYQILKYRITLLSLVRGGPVVWPRRNNVVDYSSMTVNEPVHVGQTAALREFRLALTMFLPILGPLAPVLASNLFFGERLRAIARSVEAGRGGQNGSSAPMPPKLVLLSGQLISVLTLIINVICMPFNLANLQRHWFSYGCSYYALIGLDQCAERSFHNTFRQYLLWAEISGVERNCWIPALFLSALLLAVQMESDRMEDHLLESRAQAVHELTGQQLGRDLYEKLVTLPAAAFTHPVETNRVLLRRAVRLLGSILFSLLPHFWMTMRGGTFFFHGPSIFATLLFVVNVAGILYRASEEWVMSLRSYRQKCRQFTTFQALSLDAGISVLYDPLVTRRTLIDEARQLLRDNQMESFKLRDPHQSKTWWLLRQVVINDMARGRLIMAALVVCSFCATVLGTFFSVEVMRRTGTVTSLTLVVILLLVAVSPALAVILIRVRDINQMAGEHSLLVHNAVAHMNMWRKDGNGGFDAGARLQQERFLLQLATLVEQENVQTVATFPVTPQLVSAILVSLLGLLALLLASALSHLALGAVSPLGVQV